MVNCRYSNAGNASFPLSFWPAIIKEAAARYKQPITISETGTF